MEAGDILGHENMGEVVALGSEVTNPKIGDRVVVPFKISCGDCRFCHKGLFVACDRTSPNAEMAARAMGHSPAGLFGFSHMPGGYRGGPAEYQRVPMADLGPIKIPENITDDQALFLSDIFPTRYMAIGRERPRLGRQFRNLPRLIVAGGVDRNARYAGITKDGSLSAMGRARR